MGTPGKRFATCMLCEASCGIAVSVEDERAMRIEGDREDPFSRGHVCPKAVALEDVRLDPDRVREPCVRDRSAPARGWSAVTWERAIDEAGTGISRVIREHGRDAVAVYI